MRPFEIAETPCQASLYVGAIMVGVTTSTAAQLSLSWRLERVDDTIRCIGGPDELHLLSDLAPDSLRSIEQWATTGQVDAATDELRVVRDFLASVGAIDTLPQAGTVLRWESVGPCTVTDRIAERFGDLVSHALPDLTVVVRTSGSLGELTARSADFTDPHLLVDLTGHHTISVGPFVTPRFTSCLGCYGTRLTHRWGDTHDVAKPASQRWVAVAAELLAIQVEQIARRSSKLVNATMSWDLQTGDTARNHLLRSPDCPACGRPKTSGKIG